MENTSEWWRGGVIYQIYPRSFCDSNNDGIGDLKGIMSKLDYLKSLGIDGIWMSPIFCSPMLDFGYDVSDYCDIDSIFGTLMEFDTLLEKTHASGLKLIVDQVYSHSSDQHAWFKESRSSKTNAKADWYVWADAKPDGTPPNNWISLFGGQAWSWDTRRCQYYMHNFLSEQPDLNFHNPEVQDEVKKIARFWLDRGVDGFRLDVANFYFCDQEFRDNPPKSDTGGFPRPYWHQRHLYDRSRPENVTFIEEFRTLVDEYPDRMTVAEIGSDSYVERSMEYTEPGRLHTAYNFMLLENGPLSSALIREALERWTSENAWPSWSFSNHDVVRSRTRWGGEDAPDEFAKMLMGVLLCLRGTIFIYQGEELGLPQANVPFNRLQDPEGIRFWPDSLGRDGCRTPLPWSSKEENGGFSYTEPWLPFEYNHNALAVDVQNADPDSILNKVRGFINFRQRHEVLKLGAIDFIDAEEPILVFTRTHDGVQFLCVFNLGAGEETFNLPKGNYRLLDYGLAGDVAAGAVTLPAYGGVVLEKI